jgi:peptidoglycan/LPS O-acetylase OafA/YrhL
LAVHLAIDLAAFAVTVAFAWGFWRLVEKPSIARSKAVGRKPAPQAKPLSYA